MHLKKSAGERVSDLAIYGILLFLALITLYPIYYVLIMSLSDPLYVANLSVWIVPKGLSLNSYRTVIMYSGIWQAYGNTIWYAAVGTLASLVVTLTAAYALSRRQFCARGPLMGLIAFTMFFSGGMIPLYILVTNLGLYNTRWAIVLPPALSAWNLVIARVYFQANLPDSLPESAKIDGCNDIQIFLRIALPLAKPVLAVLTLFCAVGLWNSYFPAMIYLTRAQYRPLTLLLREILIKGQMIFEAGSGYGTDNFTAETIMETFKVKYAIIIVTIVPIMTVYPFLQKYFTQGVMIGAVKE